MYRLLNVLLTLSGYPFYVNKLMPLNRSSTPSTINGTFAKIHFSRWHAVFAFRVKKERCRGVTLQTLYFEVSNDIGNQRYVLLARCNRNCVFQLKLKKRMVRKMRPIHCKWKYVDRQKVMVYICTYLGITLSFVMTHMKESFKGYLRPGAIFKTKI